MSELRITPYYGFYSLHDYGRGDESVRVITSDTDALDRLSPGVIRVLLIYDRRLLG